MIDHVSIAVRDLARATRFYESLLGTIGLTKLETRPATVGFGKKYPELWLNHRAGMDAVAPESGAHVCLRARSPEAVDAFHAAALLAGGRRCARPAAPARGRLLCGLHPRSGRQPHRGGDVPNDRQVTRADALL
jgi:catechol 2,3-dioxygenase-like lactoylglutathione lyase family enzyme